MLVHDLSHSSGSSHKSNDLIHVCGGRRLTPDVFYDEPSFQCHLLGHESGKACCGDILNMSYDVKVLPLVKFEREEEEHCMFVIIA
jgi:hypothetical protein